MSNFVSFKVKRNCVAMVVVIDVVVGSDEVRAQVDLFAGSTAALRRSFNLSEEVTVEARDGDTFVTLSNDDCLASLRAGGAYVYVGSEDRRFVTDCLRFTAADNDKALSDFANACAVSTTPNDDVETHSSRD